jgi:hypothetical protein
MKRHARLSTLAAIVFLTASYGCADDALDLTKPTVRTQSSAAPAGSSISERSALTTLTRGIALSLANDAIRAEVLQQMQTAPFKEHKLELRKYLNPGKLARTAATSGKKADDIAEALKIVRDLEFYMPIASQRESWTGDANILVASQLEDGEEIVAFDLSGRRVPLTQASPPAIPTLTIVGLETRFDKPLDLKTSKNINDRGGRAIGTIVACADNTAACASATGNRNLETSKIIDCGDCGGGSGADDVTHGLYMTFSRIVDMGEGWLRGSPEIEVHVQGPIAGGNSRYGEDLACSGEEALPARQFNQDNTFWNGSVLIWDQNQISAFNAEFSDGHNITVWEDDDIPCGLKFDKDVLWSSIASIASAVGGAALKAAGTGGVGLYVVATTFLATLYKELWWAKSNDEFLGALVTASSRGEYYFDANLVLMKTATQVNGRANIIGK